MLEHRMGEEKARITLSLGGGGGAPLSMRDLSSPSGVRDGTHPSAVESLSLKHWTQGS